MATTVGLISLGCSKNRVDSEQMLAVLKEHGYQIVSDPSRAEVIIVNTCGFIQSAKEEAISTLFEMAGYKQTGCCRLLVATGCFAQRYPEAIREEMPEVDVIMGVNDYQKLDEALREAEKGGRPVYTDDDGQFHEFGRVLTTPKYSAYVRIGEGCDNWCSYCAIPMIRGGYRSRPKADILAEVKTLAAQGVRQLLHSGSTLAVTGGSTIAATAHAMQSSAPMNVMVVPAQGGFGREVETQANTLAAEIAQRLGGHHRLLHLPDHMDEQAKQEMLRLPEIRETMERIQRADIILHGIGCAQETMSRLPVEQVRLLMKNGAVGESFGAYYDRDGQCLLKSSGVCVDLARLTPDCRMIAVAAGAKKAEAIISVLRHDSHTLLVTDEGAAKQMLAILKTNTGCSSDTEA